MFTRFTRDAGCEGGSAQEVGKADRMEMVGEVGFEHGEGLMGQADSRDLVQVQEETLVQIR